jgi:hypothetical protein
MVPRCGIQAVFVLHTTRILGELLPRVDLLQSSNFPAKRAEELESFGKTLGVLLAVDIVASMLSKLSWSGAVMKRVLSRTSISTAKVFRLASSASLRRLCCSRVFSCCRYSSRPEDLWKTIVASSSARNVCLAISFTSCSTETDSHRLSLISTRDPGSSNDARQTLSSLWARMAAPPPLY